MKTMDHDFIERESVIERYVAGKLTPELVAAFEEHYLDCAQCVEEVEAAERLQRGMGRVAAEEAATTVRRGLLAALLTSARLRAGALVAAFALAAVLPWLWQQREVTRLRGELEVARAPQGNARVYALSPFRDVGIGEVPEHEITLPPDGGVLVLALDTGGVNEGPFLAVLRRDDAEVWRSVELKPDATDAIVVSFPAKSIDAGLYLLSLEVSAGSAAARFRLRLKQPQPSP